MAKEFFYNKLSQAQEFVDNQRMSFDADGVVAEVLRGELSKQEAISLIKQIALQRRYKAQEFLVIFEKKLKEAPPPPPKFPL